MAVCWDFIKELEGPAACTGYVPDDGDEGDVGVEPGVTVASGFDLGARDEADLRSLGLDSDLIDKLYPYLGLEGSEAIAVLEDLPLEIEPWEAEQIDAASHDRAEYRVESYWDRDSGTPWGDLTDAQQTVIASVAWQYGSPWRRCPRFWGAAVGGDWDSVVAELKDFGDSFPTRREREADYLAGA